MNDLGICCEGLEVDKLALVRLEEKCSGRGIKLLIHEIETEYFIYHEDRKEIILSPSARVKHINLLTAFLLT